MAELTHVVHPFGPIYNAKSRVLMLGTLPSPKAREVGLPYGHPHNRFWPVMAKVLGVELPATNEGKRQMLLSHRVALWDVIAEADIAGASDASIKHPVPADLSIILDAAPIQAIFATGTKAGELYRRFDQARYHRPITVLPSTSPANARYGLPDLVERYRAIVAFL